MTTATQMHVGQTVRFVAPESQAEAAERFTVLELRGDRVFVQAVCDLSIKPTFVYLTSDLIGE